jgi:hypothetical protein
LGQKKKEKALRRQLGDSTCTPPKMAEPIENIAAAEGPAGWVDGSFFSMKNINAARRQKRTKENAATVTEIL